MMGADMNTTGKHSALTELRAAARRRDLADAQVRQMCVRLVADGTPIAHVAEAAGVTRKTIYRWIAPPA
jgi:transposase